jgi:hypothetical protein
MSMNPKHCFFSAVLVSAMSFGSIAPLAAAETGHTTAAVASKQAQTQDALRDLWIGHIFWVRNVALETMAGNADAAKAAETQVVANAKQIAASIEPFYGQPGSDKLLNLLVGHYGAVKAHIDATAAGDKDKLAKATKDLNDNAAQIADFLSGANPNLPRATVLSLFQAHGAHHIAQDMQLHDKQYAQEAQTWDAMRKHMYVIADALTAAIAKQFPDKFI